MALTNGYSTNMEIFVHTRSNEPEILVITRKTSLSELFPRERKEHARANTLNFEGSDSDVNPIGKLKRYFIV